MSIALLYLAVLLAICGRGRAVKCERVNGEPCQCTFTDSEGSKGMIDISDYFKYPYEPTSDDSDKYTYVFSCKNFECPKMPKPTGVACQYIKSQKSDTLLGKVNVNTTWELNNHEADKFQFVITYKNGQEGRSTQVKFTHKDSDMSMKVTGEDDKVYKMEVEGKLVKRVSSGPTSGPNKGGKGGGGSIAGPIGIVIIVLAIGAVVAYCIIGGVYMYRVKGARGSEVIPNVAFWKELPLLIKDGFFFTISPCYKRNNNYQSL